jgi:hypothetical protein
MRDWTACSSIRAAPASSASSAVEQRRPEGDTSNAVARGHILSEPGGARFGPCRDDWGAIGSALLSLAILGVLLQAATLWAFRRLAR